MNVLGLISQLIGIETLRLTSLPPILFCIYPSHYSPQDVLRYTQLSTPVEKIYLLFYLYYSLIPTPIWRVLCVISISLPFRDMSCVCVGTCACVCV